jgi:hypothetical protein
MSSLIFSPSGIFTFYLVYMLYHVLALPCFNFNQLLLHDVGLNFRYDSVHDIPNFHKNMNKIWPPKIMLDNF